MYEPGTLKAVAYKNGKKWAEKTIETTQEAERLALVADKPSISRDGQELIFVTVRVLDKQGRTVPTAHPVIRCSLTGQGTIVATDNGDPTCHIAFAETTRPAFNGLMLVIIKAVPGKKGPIRLTVSSEDLEPASITVNTRSLICVS